MAHYLSGLGDAAANCSKASTLASKLPASLADELISACCGKSSEDCGQKMMAMAGQVYCMAQTSGACAPCCSFVATKAAAVLMYSLDKIGIGGVFRDYFNLGADIISAIIPGGSCDFTPDMNKAMDAAVKAGKAIATALSDTWIDLHGQMGIPIPPNAARDEIVQVQFDPDYGRLDIMPFGATPKPGWGVLTITWENLIVNKAANSSQGKFYGPADSSYGSLILPMVPRDNNIPLTRYFRMEKAHWRCDNAQQFQEAVRYGINFRMKGLDDTYKYFQVQIAKRMNEMIYAKEKSLYKGKLTIVPSIGFAVKRDPLAYSIKLTTPAPAPAPAPALEPKPLYSEQDKIKIALLLALAAGIGIYVLKTRK